MSHGGSAYIFRGIAVSALGIGRFIVWSAGPSLRGGFLVGDRPVLTLTLAMLPT
ncbi:hypothetical protein KCP71_21085 [Salmonella enterica subsp. enterica]|nr:hypothetical protein KCP71_21085 [Salmonella enterica subsp. enterica]